MTRRLYLLLVLILMGTFPALCIGQLPKKIGISPFKDVGIPPSFTLQPESLQAFLSGNLRADHGIDCVALSSASKTIDFRTDPNTQLLPPTYRTGGWKGNTLIPIETDWRDVARKRRLTLLIYGIYEESGENIRYAAEGMEPISGRILFSCRAEGKVENRFAVEDRLAEKIGLKMVEIDVNQVVTQARQEVYQQRLVSEGLADTNEFLSIAQKDPTAEDHYENGYSLTRQYETSQDNKYLEGAADEYRSALALDPNHFRALNNMGTVMHRLEKFEDAIAYYNRVLEINPTYARAMENAALAFQSLNRYDEALAMWKRALDYEDRSEIRKTIVETISKLEESVEGVGQ